MSDSIVYLITEGEYEDRTTRWATLEPSIAQSIVAADSSFWVEGVPLIGSVPIHSTQLWLSAYLSRGALDVSERLAPIWEFDGSTEPTVEQSGPEEHLEGMSNSVSWWFRLDVYGVNHDAVRELFEERLGRLKEATAVPPKSPNARRTVEIGRSQYANAAVLLKRPVQDLEFVRVGSNYPQLTHNLVAMVDGREVRVTISDEDAEALTGKAALR